MDNYSNLLMDECPPDLRSPEDESKPPIKKATKGVATSFGFRKSRTPPASSAALTSNNPTAARRLATTSNNSVDNNGNANNTNGGGDSNLLSAHTVTGHRLPPPKKEAQATTKVSRFGFRQTNANRLNRVADINTNPPTRIEISNNNLMGQDTKERERIELEIKAKVEMQQRQLAATDSNRNRPLGIGKYTLHTQQLPKPQPIKLLESKMAKTLANNNRKQGSKLLHTSGDESSSHTEDSGVGSNCGGEIQQLNKSPMSRRLRNAKLPKPRNLDVVLSGNKFDVRDIDEESVSEQTLPTLPTLSVVTGNYANNSRSNLGFVRDRAMDYQRNVIDKQESRMRKTSLTSSEASNYEDDKPYKRNEKIAKFIKQKVSSPQEPSSSDDQMWSSHAGETMAEELSSVCISSSDESRDKAPDVEPSIEMLISQKAHSRLSLDKQFAAMAAAHKTITLIEDEPSPSDSALCSYSDNNDSIVTPPPMNPDNDKTMLANTSTASNSKDVNEKNSTSSPGSPTNASNSLSLSDGREDFLIDDEIADQPALLFDDTLTNSTHSARQSEVATPTIVDNTPKLKRRQLGMDSPASLRVKKGLSLKTTSLDTLSPCESIASDDCIMDYDFSSAGEDVNDRTETNSYYNLEDIPIKPVHVKVEDMPYIRDWSSLLGRRDCERDSSKRLSLRSSIALKSRGGTPTSSLPDSPRSELMKKTSISHSPLRLSGSRSSTGTGTGYESDDSAVIRVEPNEYRAMQQNLATIKSSMIKLREVLQDPSIEDVMLTSETHSSLNDNGFFNGFGSDCERDSEQEARDEMENLRRQNLFLQGQLEDAQRLAQSLRDENLGLTLKIQSSCPASIENNTTNYRDVHATLTSNAATQTERIRPISAGPALLQGANTNDLSPGSLVSLNEHNNNNNNNNSSNNINNNSQTPPTPATRRSRPVYTSTPNVASAQKSGGSPVTPSRLWRMPGEPPLPSAIPRRSTSRTRVAGSTLTATSTSSST